ncbi:cytochrome P450 [Guyanagaster necrorhizus]|uniref:Cytochrome P450 n=1 Tax=Guyanagaster necrorhizus TaxID=856835 RepID=A0A9P7VND5_9AGAR|nr:cytochrome P450 [Guyanagaster necrorhizus MCA 3950]KAG7443919.1 cytochrome P450 [Guyanagaster necrorhizus MCA 3950]
MHQDAALKGADFVPDVQQSSFSIMRALMRHTKTLMYPGEMFLEWHRQYGNTYCINIFSESRIITIEPEHVKAVLATQFKDFEKGPRLFSQWADLLGTGVFNSDGDMWKYHRNMTRPFFSKDRISDFDNFERHAVETIRLIKDRLEEGYPVDFQDVVSRFTLDSATEFLFGEDICSLSARLPYPSGWSQSQAGDTAFAADHPSNIFVRAFVKGQELIARRSRTGTMWPLLEFWHNKVTPHRHVIEGIVQPLLDDAFARKKQKADAGEALDDKEKEVTSLLDDLVEDTEDTRAIIDELVNILVASRDTTASLLTFAVYALTENPHIVKCLREEIAQALGDKQPTYADIRDMKYLRAFLNETLRLYPPVPFDSRTANVDTTLPNTIGRPYYVASGTKVLWGVFWMHRRVDLWGPDALDFDPDRFLDSRLHKYLTPNPFIFLPFNTGPRICLGQQFAYNEASYFVIRLLQTFSSFSIAQDAQAPEAKPPVSWAGDQVKGRDKIMFGTHLTMFAKEGMWVRME